MVKIKTALKGSWGSEVSTGGGLVKFDENGSAEVSQEMAEYLMGNFPDVYYEDGEDEPTPRSGTHVDASKDPAVTEFAKGHTKQKDAERNGAPPAVVKSSTKEEEENAGKSKGLVDAKGNPVSSEDEENDEESAEENAEENAEEKAEEEAGENAEESVEKSDEVNSKEAAKAERDEVLGMLRKLSVEDIHKTLEQANVQDSKTKKITNKRKLVQIAAKKLT